MKTTNIMIVGVGGQGSLLASKLLGRLLVDEGYDVKVSEVHGMSQRGGSVVTYVRFGEKVYSPIITEGEADYIVSFEKLEAARWASCLAKGGQIIVNTQEPEEFRTIREKLETFSKNELGIHAIQYPRAKLVELAEESIALGKTKWEDRDVQHGNLFAALTAFKEAIFYLETVDPKPDCITDARKGLEDATKELERRYSDQRFLADRAINLGQWEDAQRELQVLLEMVPDRGDDRNREASAKLIDVEKRMKKGGK